jgi:hypothetical protein
VLPAWGELSPPRLCPLGKRERGFLAARFAKRRGDPARRRTRVRVRWRLLCIKQSGLRALADDIKPRYRMPPQGSPATASGVAASDNVAFMSEAICARRPSTCREAIKHSPSMRPRRSVSDAVDGCAPGLTARDRRPLRRRVCASVSASPDAWPDGSPATAGSPHAYRFASSSSPRGPAWPE